MTPLADRLRPETLDDIVGQKHLVGEGKPLRNLLSSGSDLPNLIFYGPPGTGKTTVARIIAAATQRKLIKLNGTSASTADIRDAVSQIGTVGAVNGVLLYLDEIQYFNKKQQQSLLEYIENGSMTLIASTTENPYFYVYNAILSRSTVFEFKAVEAAEIEKAVRRGFGVLEAESPFGLDIDDEVFGRIAMSANGDVRRALNIVEMSVLGSDIPPEGGKRRVTVENAVAAGASGAAKYDKFGDEHYDLLSAFQKSMRGSDADAAVHYLARILAGGDLVSAIRRLSICACEDVGLAYPQIIPIVNAACEIALRVGLPEAQIPLSDAVILVCTSPKSNSGCVAVEKAAADIAKGKSGPIPRNLQNVHLDSSEVRVKGQHYLYPHSFPGHWVKQQYMPTEMLGTVYYVPGENRIEQAAAEYMRALKKP